MASDSIFIRAYRREDIPSMVRIWNQVVEEGIAFPQMHPLDLSSGTVFFESQTYNAVAVDTATGEILGLYILHPNNEGRCGHICNASYAVRRDCRDQGAGEALVRHCQAKGKELDYKILQFNAVVACNHRARHVYKKLGFIELGIIPGGFLYKDGHYEDIVPQYCLL